MHRVDARLAGPDVKRLDLAGDDGAPAGQCGNADGNGTVGPVLRFRAAMGDPSRRSSELAKLKQELARIRCEAAALREEARRVRQAHRAEIERLRRVRTQAWQELSQAQPTGSEEDDQIR